MQMQPKEGAQEGGSAVSRGPSTSTKFLNFTSSIDTIQKEAHRQLVEQQISANFVDCFPGIIRPPIDGKRKGVLRNRSGQIHCDITNTQVLRIHIHAIDADSNGLRMIIEQRQQPSQQPIRMKIFSMF